jgi:hypothetical protein
MNWKWKYLKNRVKINLESNMKNLKKLLKNWKKKAEDLKSWISSKKYK